VKEQIRIAQGIPLSYGQADIRMQGHAIELRVYAEDPDNNFLPDIGTLLTYSTPKGIGVRVDDGFEQGMEIPIYYDPMIAKLITYGSTREDAIERMIRAIEEYQITGIKTTLPFGKFVMEHEAFRSGDFDTHFVSKYFKSDSLVNEQEDEALIAAVVAVIQADKPKAVLSSTAQGQLANNWRKNRLNN
jgi:acetyl-CoA carboxylase biotin carboxylase subunit